MFYVAYDTASNIVITRYDTEIAPLPDPLPSGTAVIEVPDQATMLSTTAPGWTVQNGVLVAPPPPSAAELLAQAQAAQIAILQSSYQSAINAPVTFKNAAGVTSTYPSGNTVLINGMRAKDLLAEVIAAGEAAWTLGKWLDTNNVAQTFTFADLQGLAAAMEAATTVDWTDLVDKIAQVNAATTVSAVQAVTW